MVLTTLGTEIIGQKGTGILTHVAVDAAEGAAKVAVKDAVKVAAETKADAKGGITKDIDGFYQIKPQITPIEGQVRLNTLDITGSGGAKPAEAAVAAQLEGALGKMERAPAGATYDFITQNGQKVDVMYSTGNLTQKEVDGLNRFYEKNMTVTPPGKTMPLGQQTILDHIQKSDVVPVDLRNLTSENQRIFMDFAKTLSEDQKSKILIVR